MRRRKIHLNEKALVFISQLCFFSAPVIAAGTTFAFGIVYWLNLRGSWGRSLNEELIFLTVLWVIAICTCLQHKSQSTLTHRFQSRLIDMRADESDSVASTKARWVFLGMASHEFRGPLQVLSANLESLESRAMDNAVVAQCVPLMRSATDRLEARINDLMRYALECRTGYSVNVATMRLDKFCEQLRLEATHLSGMTRAKIIIDISESCPEQISSDESRLWQVIINLLTNALSHTSDGFVRVGISSPSGKGGPLRLEVSDTGCGIPEHDLSKVTEPFFRSSLTPRGIPGTGLGLSIVNQILMSLGGSLKIESKVGVGTTVTAEIPI